VHVSAAQDPDPPPSVDGCGMHVLFTQTLLPVHAPQLTGTPHPSMATTPQRPAHDFGWHTCDAPLLTQTWPPVHAVPHSKALPVHGST
jgi:hypothetical protein